jgi:hypothetical protein
MAPTRRGRGPGPHTGVASLGVCESSVALPTRCSFGYRGALCTCPRPDEGVAFAFRRLEARSEDSPHDNTRASPVGRAMVRSSVFCIERSLRSSQRFSRGRGPMSEQGFMRAVGSKLHGGGTPWQNPIFEFSVGLPQSLGMESIRAPPSPLKTPHACAESMIWCLVGTGCDL